MPAWTSSLIEAFPGRPELQSEGAYRLWFLRLCGVLGDPVAAKARIAEADDEGIKLGAAAYGYRPAFKNRLGSHDLSLLQELLTRTWSHQPVVLDPTAGGGSIPYQSARFGLPTSANDLNPIAAAILSAGLTLPSTFGAALGEDLRTWGSILVGRIRSRLLPYFALPDNSSDNNSYVFARTITCPRTGKPVPLSPNWWLSRGDKPVAVRLVTRHDGRMLDRVDYQIVEGSAIDFDPALGTVAGGDAISPWDGLAIDSEYIRAEAQAGRMGSDLYAVAVRRSSGRGFRPPTATDIEALDLAERTLAANLSDWLARDIVPSEAIPEGNKTTEPRQRGMTHWRDMFSSRQLLGPRDVCGGIPTPGTGGP